MSTLQNLKLRITGVSPLVMHSGRLVDPNYWAAKDLKALTSKRSKTDADLQEMAKIEFAGSLYVNEQQQIVLPDVMVEAALVAGSKKLRLGPKAKAGLFVEGHAVLQPYADVRPEALWENKDHQLYVPVKVGVAKIMRMRPIFRQWSAEIEVRFFDDLLSANEVLRLAEYAGQQCGIGDWRPKHGRFSVEKI